MSNVLQSVKAEYRRYQSMAEAATAQLSDEEFFCLPSGDANSVAVLTWHVGGNFASRFTDFLTTDGEKPWRNRDGEFEIGAVTRPEVMEKWSRGWSILFDALDPLTMNHLEHTVTIRGTELRVHEALLRSLGHVSYHVGQIVLLARTMRGDAWKTLTIPKGASEEYNRNPRFERADAHTDSLREESDD